MASKTSTRAAANPKLSEFLCFAVYSANLAFGKAYRPLLDELGLTYTQYITLVCLSEQDGQTVSELGGKLFLDGRVDFVHHHGHAGMRTEGRSDEFSQGLVQWNLGRMAFATAPSADWQVRDLQERGSELDGALRLLVNLGADRPENAQLLLQSSARWLRADRIGDTAVDVFEGPKQKDATDSRLRYWLDADGKLRRLEAKLGNQEELAVFDFTGPAHPVQLIPQLGGG